MTAKITASADGTKVLIGTAAEDALQIDNGAKTVSPVPPYQLLLLALSIINGAGARISFNGGAGDAGQVGAGVFTGLDNSLGIDAGAGGLHLGAGSVEGITVNAQGKVSFPAMGQVLAAYGYIRLPGGLIVQWGENSDVTGNAGVSFPITFPNSVIGMQVTGSNGSLLAADQMVTASYNSLNNSGCQISARFFSQTSGMLPSGWPIRWIAYGW